MRISSTELAEDLQKLADALRKQFRFKRTDIDVANPGDGTGSIITPTFTYSVSVSLNHDDPSEVIWHRQVSEIREPDTVLTDEFEAVFDKTFDTVQFSPFNRVDVTALIDRIENLEDDRITVDYDSNPTACKMSIEGIDGDILVSRSEISLVQTQRQTPKQLLESLFQIQTALIDTFGVRLIAFNQASKT